MFPTNETVKLFLAMCNRDGTINAMMDLIDKQNEEYKPSLNFLKLLIAMIDKTEYKDVCVESLTIGFMTCFNLFRLQIEASNMDVADLQSNIDALSNYVEYLEKEVIKINEKCGDIGTQDQNTGVH